jgi:hypothetical protein
MRGRPPYRPSTGALSLLALVRSRERSCGIAARRCGAIDSGHHLGRKSATDPRGVSGFANRCLFGVAVNFIIQDYIYSNAPVI